MRVCVLNMVGRPSKLIHTYHFGGPIGKFCPTMEVAFIFPECVSDGGAKDHLVVGGKMAGITDSISPNNPSIRAEKIIRP